MFYWYMIHGLCIDITLIQGKGLIASLHYSRTQILIMASSTPSNSNKYRVSVYRLLILELQPQKDMHTASCWPISKSILICLSLSENHWPQGILTMCEIWDTVVWTFKFKTYVSICLGLWGQFYVKLNIIVIITTSKGEDSFYSYQLHIT